MVIHSRVFEREPPCVVCSVIQICGSFASNGAQKNGLRLLRAGPDRLVRSAGAASSRLAVRGISDCSGTRSAARRVPLLWHSEARTAGFSRGQCALHQTLCVLCRPPLPAGIDPGCCRGAQARLGHGQDAGEAVDAGSAQACRHARAPSDRHRRDLGPQRPQLSHRGQRPGSQAADLVRRRGSVRGQHGWRSTTGWGSERAAKSSSP
jgi:hypothetical protein